MEGPLAIGTPVAEAAEQAAAAVAAAARAAAAAAAPAGAAAAAASRPAGRVGAFIPSASYSMPPPTWRVKPQFAAWEVDHDRFEIKRLLGKGSYGSVAEAFDHLTNQRVAIKKIPGIFEVFENAKRIYREVRILRLLAHPNVVRIVHLQQPADLLAFTDLYVVFECMDTDFAKLTRDDTQCLTIPHVRWFLYQLLLALKYIHSARVLHRDVKPANILLTESCDLKLCDFGLARSLDDDLEEDDTRDLVGVASRATAVEEAAAAGGSSGGGASAGAAAGEGAAPAAAAAPTAAAVPAAGAAGDAAAPAAGAAMPVPGPVHRVMTRHVVTRWYRAPELPLYNDGEYSTAVDVWSVGCVFAEMLGMLDTGDPDCRYNRRALFPGGSCYPLSRERRDKATAAKDKKDQLAVIFEVLGTPSDEDARRARTDAAQEYLRSLKPRKAEDLNARFPTAGRDAVAMLRRFLAFHPQDRLSIDEALAHAFLAPVRRPHDESVRTEGPVHFRRVTPDNIRELLVEEIRAYNAGIPDNWKVLAAALLYRRTGGGGEAAAEGDAAAATQTPPGAAGDE